MTVLSAPDGMLKSKELTIFLALLDEGDLERRALLLNGRWHDDSPPHNLRTSYFIKHITGQSTRGNLSVCVCVCVCVVCVCV